MTSQSLALVFALASALGEAPPPSFSSSQWWFPSQKQAQADLEGKLDAVTTAASLRAFHDLLGSEPHVAGSDGDARNIDRIIQAFTGMGLTPVRDGFWAYLCKPVDAKLEIVESPGDTSHTSASQPAQTRRGVVGLSLREENLLDDPMAQHPGLNYGWNAYSGNGDLTAEVVYANYGTKEDFEKLRDLKIDVTGKIALCRYGGNFRGYKAKYAQAAGAGGVVIYTDPEDSGYRKGVTYPEGGWANASCIQRGSINSLDYPGDPLTPEVPATEHAARLDPATLDLPRIPVQPIGYGAAQQIMMRMRGTPLPENLIKTWQGGIPCAYRLTGGPSLKLHLMVKQERAVTKSANVIAEIRGERYPGEKIIIGCHHDAWGFGAGDPLAGTILVMEAAKNFSEMLKQGIRPARTIVFALWGGEEFGIIGSTEYCEGHRDELTRTAVAYINLDAATMGTTFGASASPTLRTLIREVAHDVPQARGKDGETAFDVWKGDKPDAECGDMGGGSDHIGFYCHLGIPSCGLGSGGGPGTAYHSNYDDLLWYRKVVGEDYLPAVMMTNIVNRMTSRLANASLLPLDPGQYVIDARKHLDALEKRATELKMTLDLTSLRQSVAACEKTINEVWPGVLKQLADGTMGLADLESINEKLLLLGRVWLPHQAGPDSALMPLPNHPWFKNWYGSSDPTSGYAAWVFPALREALEARDGVGAIRASATLAQIFNRLDSMMQALKPNPIP